MYTINEDLSIYATRGDIVAFSVAAEDNGTAYKFQPGDVVRIKVYGRKDAESVVLQKDFPVFEETEQVEIFLSEQDTKFGEVISKPTDYWYEVELNPYNNPQTIIGYDEDGAKVFKLFPEGDDIPEYVPAPEVVKVIDDELDLTSPRPVQNQAIARAVTQLNGAVRDNKKTILNEMRSGNRKAMKKVYKPFVYPDGFNGAYKPVNVYWDGENFTTDFNKADWMYSGGTTYYVSVGGNYLNDGLSRENPVQLYQAITRAADGDTIIITEGVYSIGDLPLSEYNLARNVNIIGEGKVVLAPGSRIWNDFVKDSASGLWKAAHPLPVKVLSLDNFEITLVAASSIANCASTTCSYYHDGTNLYINTAYNPNNRLLILHETIGFICDNTENCRLYMENITIIGGASNFHTSKSPEHKLEVILNNCNFLYSLYERAAVRFAGGNALLVNCKALYSHDDGFGYVAYNTNSEYVETNFMEIDCVGANNGLLADVENKNGSTAHSGIKGIRVNGLYYNNFGGNVADVQEGTQSVNLGCEAYDSAAESTSQGFGLQQAGATMWLYNCKAHGNSADLVAYGNTTAYTHNCIFDYVAGGGKIAEID